MMRAFLKGARDRLRSTLATLQPSPQASQPWTTHESNVAVYECLSRRDPPIPNEIILQILDDPSRWIRTRITSTPLATETQPIRVGSGYQNRGEARILTTYELSSLEVVQIRSIVFTFTTEDQGWSHDYEHHGTFDASWTWMEASLSRHTTAAAPESESDEQLQLREAKEKTRYELQRNRHAARQSENYRHELRGDHELLQSIEAGDSVVLWARAMFPAWENRVYRASMEVWCMDDLTGTMSSTA